MVYFFENAATTFICPLQANMFCYLNEKFSPTSLLEKNWLAPTINFQKMLFPPPMVRGSDTGLGETSSRMLSVVHKCSTLGGLKPG